MEKTAREWFNEMPEPYGTLAIKNCEAQPLNDLDTLYCSPEVALGNSFFYELTPEGVDFWNEVSSCIVNRSNWVNWPAILVQSDTPPEPSIKTPTPEPDKYTLFQLAARSVNPQLHEKKLNALFDIAQMVLNNPDGGDIKQLSQILAKHNIK